MELAHPGHWVANLGLEDAFLYVPIYAEHREYLRFYSMGQSYVIPFGESLVPMVFTMALEPGPSGNTGAHQSPSPVGHALRTTWDRSRHVWWHAGSDLEDQLPTVNSKWLTGQTAAAF